MLLNFNCLIVVLVNLQLLSDITLECGPSLQGWVELWVDLVNSEERPLT